MTKPENPKRAFGTNKLPLHLWPATATALGSLAMLEGALKYGECNYLATDIRASDYLDAIDRHMKAWSQGETCAPDSKIPHLGHALACIAIIADAEAAGTLIDDRPLTGGYLELVGRLTPLVAELRARHADKNPRHYTIADVSEVKSAV